MTLTIDLTPVEEERLAEAALQAGLAPVTFLKKYVDSLPLTKSIPSKNEDFKKQKNCVV
jgi:hypothetical protein